MTTEHALELLSSWRDKMTSDGFTTDTELQDYDEALKTLEQVTTTACRIIDIIRYWNEVNKSKYAEAIPLEQLLDTLQKECSCAAEEENK